MPIRDIVRGLSPVALIISAMFLLKSGWIDIRPLQELLLAHAGAWWLLPVILILQIGFYSVALPGSVFIVLAGLIFPVPVATLVAVIGGLAGGWLAFLIARHGSAPFTARHTNARWMHVLRSHLSFFALLAWRVLPGMPHAVINFGAGSLGAKPSTFFCSTAIGFTVKAYVYASAVDDTLYIDAETTVLTWSALWPLAAMTVLALVGVAVERRIMKEKA